MWESPIYRFRIPEDEDPEKLKEIVIDVTGSAPPFKEPSDALKEILDEIFKSDSFKKIDMVLEFGAAKLKNIPYILKKGKTVCAVEFKELTKILLQKKILRNAKDTETNFKKWFFLTHL